MNADELARDMFMDESNYNNGDTQSGQIVYTEAEIKKQILDRERCPVCGELLENQDYIVERNLCTDDPYPIYENIVVGHRCWNCKEREDY